MNLELLQLFQRLSGFTYRAVRLFETHSGGQPLEAVIERVTVDRYRMGVSYYEFARDVFQGMANEAAYRSVISRNYYAMFQTGRAAIFHISRQDVEDHQTLASHLRSLIGQSVGDTLSRWRELRNEVDYAPYPDLRGMSLMDLAAQSLTEADTFLNEIADFLRKRGVVL
jgi:uncharacterized protein (UPF0332 family)